MNESASLAAARTPVVYFIDDSATMREVIKIAFRKENIHVVTCPDAASALAQFEVAPPDAVITDVIMPDKDGYEVCQFIKQHSQFGRTPVILMSGVVNRTVAERAMAVRADELIRKPFQPQDLITRVRNLLHPRSASLGENGESLESAPFRSAAENSSQALSNLFSPAPSPVPNVAAPSRNTATLATPPRLSTSPAPHQRLAAPANAEVQKLRSELRRLELLVKKLQAELEAEHQYCAALEAHIKTLQESE